MWTVAGSRPGAAEVARSEGVVRGAEKVKLYVDRVGERNDGRGRDRNVLVSWSGAIVNVLVDDGRTDVAPVKCVSREMWSGDGPEIWCLAPPDQCGFDLGDAEMLENTIGDCGPGGCRAVNGTSLGNGIGGNVVAGNEESGFCGGSVAGQNVV